MSAFYDRPDDFLEWLGNSTTNIERPSAASFVPRQLYGEYIRFLLNAELKRREQRNRLKLVHSDVVSLDRSGHPLVLKTDQGETVTAALAVLAIGNFPPAAPPLKDPSFYDSPFYHPDPWATDARGRSMPCRGVDFCPVTTAPGGTNGHRTGPNPTNVRKLMRQLRQQVERIEAAGGNWRAAIDGLRPFTQDLWQCMTLAERARFLRHLRVWWDTFRHRMAGAVACRIEAARASGQLRIHRGHLQKYRIVDGEVDVVYRPRGSDDHRGLCVSRVINCSGPFADYSRIPHPLVRHLLDTGVARPDALRLGLDVTNNCALLSADGAISRRLFAIGPITKSAFWEMTAVPDIRRQAELLAHHLVALVPPPHQ